MRMYTLWKRRISEEEPRRLEDAGGPVLFPRTCDAVACSRDDPDRWEVHFTVVPVTVGLA
jgi:hypothetical protein